MIIDSTISVEKYPIEFFFFSAISFNQPKFCPNAVWNPNATTFANHSTVGHGTMGLFINRNNTIFVPNRDNGDIVIFFNGTNSLSTTIQANLSDSWVLFVTDDNQIFVDNRITNARVDRWALNGTRIASPIFTISTCYGLFVDINNDLYCSEGQLHQVVKIQLNNPSIALEIVAGTGCPGYLSHLLNIPQGIFVTTNSDLYVADSTNNRIQFFRFGETTAATVAGNGSSGTISLLYPSDVVLDADGYLFIVDQNQNRVVGSNQYGFRCLVGCSGSAGARPDQFGSPFALSFDTDGNMFITDASNSRIQKFHLFSNYCSK